MVKIGVMKSPTPNIVAKTETNCKPGAVRPISNVVLLPCLAGSTVARLQHDLVSDVAFNSVELKDVAVN